MSEQPRMCLGCARFQRMNKLRGTLKPMFRASPLHCDPKKNQIRAVSFLRKKTETCSNKPSGPSDYEFAKWLEILRPLIDRWVTPLRIPQTNWASGRLLLLT